MTKINRAWNTRDDMTPSGHRGPSKEQFSKDQKRDKNMAKLLTQLDLLTKHIIGGNCKSVNAVGAIRDVMFKGVTFEGG